jgi:hypothetical protein
MSTIDCIVHNIGYVHVIVNKHIPVNNPVPRGASLERALLEKLREILGQIAWVTDLPSQRGTEPGGPDITIPLASETGPPAILHMHVKNEMRPSTFQAWAAQRTDDSRENAVPLLAAPVVSPRLAELCQRANWSWIDLAGNCWLDVPGRLHIDRSGNPSAHRPPQRAANLGTSAAARVMRALLSPAHAGRRWTQRELQDATRPHAAAPPISLGLVNKMLSHLRSEGYVSENTSGERGVLVKEPLGLLRAWSEAYRFDRHERRSYFTLLKPAEFENALYKTGAEAGGLAAYAAFSAAERQAPQVRQPRTWVYVTAESLDTLTKNTQAKEVDSGENLIVLIPDDPGVFLSFEAGSFVGDRVLGCTSPVQTYVDLMHCGGRGEEAAEAVLEQRILPTWRSAGLA